MNAKLNMSRQPEFIDWQAAIETHRPWLRKVLRSRVGDSHAVDDLMQEISLSVVKQTSKNGTEPGSLPTDSDKVAPWLYQLAVRQAVNFYRRKNKKSAPQLVEEMEVLGTDPQPLDWLLREEKQMSVGQAIQKLDPESREIMTLKYTENWTYRQLAEHLGVTEKAIEHRLTKAKKLLRRSLQKSLLVD